MCWIGSAAFDVVLLVVARHVLWGGGFDVVLLVVARHVLWGGGFDVVVLLVALAAVRHLGDVRARAKTYGAVAAGAGARDPRGGAVRREPGCTTTMPTRAGRCRPQRGSGGRRRPSAATGLSAEPSPADTKVGPLCTNSLARAGY
ncbi:hypothetical protein GCM10010218_65500 [Streptomyces mashuensis]|uniref:Uncharacterized protein n=1 Tax=Streptomyces mashuensis TaxID=33904 RepID=A0A919B9A0_9ACTN|nr:hypothetical protein GCM10010218_65500 [Streptomyces mashuensis]